MAILNAYSGPRLAGSMHRYLASRLIFIILLLFLTEGIYSQDLPEYDEISIFLYVPRTGGGEIDAVIRDNILYLPITDLFNFLKIRNVPSSDLETIKGFFINPEADYEIRRDENSIIYQDKTFDLNPGDLIRTETNLYLRSDYFGRIFGLECVFNFRNLAVTITSDLELPYIREMKMDEMRRNLSRLKGEVKADTNIGRTYPLFKFGMADWSAIATEEINGLSETRLNLSLGSMVAGGELTASLNYNSNSRITERQQHYLWRFVNNDFKPLRQVSAGKIATKAVATIYSPVIGIQLTNTPTTYRRSFGTYRLTDKTDPGWIVELYVNNVLVDYTTSDASGSYSFDIPLVYGNSIVNLKFYSPWGEERTREQNITIPFNFLPHKIFEYNLSAGIVEDSLANRFSRGSFNYGLTKNITLGGGAEYLSSVTSGEFMPFVNASLRLTNNLLLSGDYTYGVRAKGTLSYRLPSNMQFDINYTWYDPDQTAINLNYREERKASVSIPLKIGKFSSYQRMSVYQIVSQSSKYTTAEWLFSGSVFGINTNLTTYGIFREEIEPNIYSNLSMAFRLPAGFVLMPQTQYSYTSNEFLSARLRLEKPLMKHAFLNLSYEQNFKTPMKMAEIGFRYDFSFAQTGLSVRQADNRTTFVEYARGSLISDRKTRYLGTDNRTNVGRGGIVIIPFLDINANRKKDPGEPKAFGLNLRISGGRVEKSEKDTTIRILGLEPYVDYFIELDPNSFENIAWRLDKKSLSVTVDPNILKTVEVPVIVSGEANGTVTLIKEGQENGLEGIIINFLTKTFKPAGRTLTENDGFYSYFGLEPGEYNVMPDTSQLSKLGMISDPVSLSFNVGEGTDGDIIDNLNFRLAMKPGDTTNSRQKLSQIPVVKKDTTYLIIHEVTQELITIAEDSWAIQLGAFRKRSNAEAYKRTLQKLLGKNVEIVVEGDFYKVRILDLKTREEVDRNIDVLHKNGVNELWVISLKAKHQQLVLKERTDSVAKITETIIESDIPVFSFEMVLQAGAFRNEIYAINLKDKLSATLNKPVRIIVADGFYKVQITGFENIEEIDKIVRALGFLGQKDLWIPPVSSRDTIAPPVIKPDTLMSTPEIQQSVPALEEKPAVQEPTFALQVGVFRKKNEALRAQRRIRSKLKLPVEIVEQWDYFHVIVTGFYTREETYKFYPELTGLGYPGISIIENYRSKNSISEPR